MHSILKALPALLLLSSYVAFLSGCASTPATNDSTQEFDDILGYHTTLGENHADLAKSVFFLSDEVRARVRKDFKSNNRPRSATKLAQWLMRPDGHNMRYDIDANLTPAQAFNEGRANCLSFSLLLIELASELDIKLKLNQVDLPDTWSEDELKDLVFYRHVNVVYKSSQQTQIFDLALQDYRTGFPQRVISKRHGMGLLFSNIGIHELQAGNTDTAFHYLKLSVSVFPENADMWINLGAAFKRNNNLDMAEKIYLKAFSINDENSLAASNLERIYRNMGKVAKAKRFEKYAQRSRLRNPYLQYRLAQKSFEQGSYKIAKKAIIRAIRLHDKDPKFYELSSRIRQTKNDYVAALKDLHTAHNLSQEALQRGRYANKIDRVIARARAYATEKNAQRKRNTRSIDIETYRSSAQIL